MHNYEVIIFVAAMAFLAVRLYQKYVKKTKGDTGLGSKSSSATSFPSSAKDDDYEPYSKK
jgi:Tfp pilus assembly major pilin PilA